MTTKTRVISILRGAEAHRIRFTVPATIGTITINRASFESVAAAILAGKIKVTAVPPSAFRPGVGAEYHTSAVVGGPSGELRVPPILGRQQEGLVLHECTHAFFDLTKSGVGASEEEAIAYVVDALYYRMSGLTPPRWSNEPHKTAKAVADTLLHQYAQGDTPVPPVGVREWQTLVLAVKLNPTYLFPAPGQTDTPAGLFGGVLGGPTSYSHDG
jgi:hypothetical protein